MKHQIKIDTGLYKQVLSSSNHFVTYINENYDKIKIGDEIIFLPVGDAIILKIEKFDEFIIGNNVYHERFIDTVINSDCSIVAEVMEIRLFRSFQEFAFECEKDNWSFFESCVIEDMMIMHYLYHGGCNYEKEKIISYKFKKLSSVDSIKKIESKDHLAPFYKCVNEIFGEYLSGLLRTGDGFGILVKTGCPETINGKTWCEIAEELDTKYEVRIDEFQIWRETEGSLLPPNSD